MYRVVALRPGDERVRERLVGYVVHRSAHAEPRDRLMRRFGGGRSVVLDRLTEAQARRVRQEIEAFGAAAEVERDEGALVQPLRAPPRTPLIALTVAAVAILCLGIYQVLQVETPPPVEPEPVAAAPADPVPVAPVAPRAPAAPEDALAGVALAGSELRPVFFVDIEGWAVGPQRLARDGQETRVRLGQREIRAMLVRRAPGTGMALYRMRRPAPFALSLGDASVLGAGDRLYVADPHAAAMRATEVVEPNHRVGRFVYLRFEAPTPESALDGAPIFDTRGLMVGVFDHAASVAAAMPLALPVNRLVEGKDALLSLVQPARLPEPKMTAWLEAAAADDRAEKPALYSAIEGTLLLTVSCPGATCTGQVGVLRLESGAPASRTLEAEFLEPEQPPTEAPRYGRTGDVDLTVDWHEAPLGESLLLGALARDVRRAVLRGDAAALRLFVASYRVRRPPSARGQPLRLRLLGPAGRESPSRLVGEESAQVPGDQDDVQDR